MTESDRKGKKWKEIDINNYKRREKKNPEIKNRNGQEGSIRRSLKKSARSSLQGLFLYIETKVQLNDNYKSENVII